MVARTPYEITFPLLYDQLRGSSGVNCGFKSIGHDNEVLCGTKCVHSDFSRCGVAFGFYDLVRRTHGKTAGAVSMVLKILIIVVVTMDFMTQVQAYAMSHQYESLLKKANFKGSGLPVK